jgi:TRAP transporter TAXI family solute receptor
MRKLKLVTLLLATTSTLAPLTATQVYAAEAVSLRFATVGIGSAWYNYGAGIADIAQKALPTGSSIDVLPIAGGVGNMKLLQKGEAELAISFQMPAAEACGGFGSFDMKHDKVRGIIGGLDSYYFSAFMTKSSGVTSWQQIAGGKSGIKLLTTKVGGTGETGVRQVLALLNSSKDAVSKKGGSVKAMARKATGSAIADGSADGWAHVVTRGHPVATQLTTTTDMILVGLPDNVIDGMVSKHGWVPATIPSNTFKGQINPVKTVKASSNIMVSSDVADDVVYAFTKALIANADKVKKIHAGLSSMDLKEAAKPGYIGNCQRHPGAEKALKEAGLL